VNYKEFKKQKYNLGQIKRKEYFPNVILNLFFTVISAFIAAEERTRYRNKLRKAEIPAPP